MLWDEALVLMELEVQERCNRRKYYGGFEVISGTRGTESEISLEDIYLGVGMVIIRNIVVEQYLINHGTCHIWA